MDSLPEAEVSISALPRSTILPRPVAKPSLTPLVPYIIPPVGKSGAFIYCIRPSTSISGSAKVATIPSMTSVKL